MDLFLCILCRGGVSVVYLVGGSISPPAHIRMYLLRAPAAAVSSMALMLAAAVCGGVTEGSACAQIVQQSSQVWVDAPSHVKKFVFRVRVREWIPFSKVTLEWEDDDLVLDNMYDAQPVDGYDGGGTMTVELGPAPSERNQFLMMGTDTNNFHPKITCE